MVTDTQHVCFHQPCPVCGRTLQIRIQLLGRRVYCQHCGGGFVALESGLRSERPETRLDAVDELLERASLALEASSPEDGFRTG